MCSSSSPVRMRTRSPVARRADVGVTSLPSAADSQAKRAPARPRARAAARAAGSRRIRYSSIARAAAGWVAARNGSTKTSLSQKTCPLYAAPLSPRAPTAASPRSPTDEIRWKSAKRTARCSSGSPSMTTSASRQRRAHASRCSRSSRSNPACFASARAARATLGSQSYEPRRSKPLPRRRSCRRGLHDCRARGRGRGGSSRAQPGREARRFPAARARRSGVT